MQQNWQREAKANFCPMCRQHKSSNNNINHRQLYIYDRRFIEMSHTKVDLFFFPQNYSFFDAIIFN